MDETPVLVKTPTGWRAEAGCFSFWSEDLGEVWSWIEELRGLLRVADADPVLTAS